MSQNQQEQSEAKLLAYLEEELGPAGRAEIEKHLEAHPQHRRLLEELRGMRDWVRWLPRDSAPADLAEGFQAQLERAVLLGPAAEEERPASPMRIDRWPQVRRAAAVAGLAAGLGVIVYFALPSPHGPPVVKAPSTRPTNQIALATAATAPSENSVAPSPAGLADAAPPAADAFGQPGLSTLPADAAFDRKRPGEPGGAATPDRSVAADIDGASSRPAGQPPATPPAAPGNLAVSPSGAGVESEQAAARAGREALARAEPHAGDVAHADKRGAADSPAPAAIPAPGTPAAPPAAAKPAEPREQMDQLARAYYPSYGRTGPNRDAARRDGADAASRLLAERKQAAAGRASPLVLVVVAPDAERARQQISQYCETNHIQASVNDEAAESAALGGGAGPPAGPDGRRLRTFNAPGGTNGSDARAAGADRTAPAGPAPARSSPPQPAPPAAERRSAPPGGSAAAGGAGPHAPEGAAPPRPGGVERREAGRVREENKGADPRLLQRPGLPPAAPAPAPARPSAPAPMPAAGVAGVTPGRGAPPAGAGGGGALGDRDRLNSPPLNGERFPDPALDNSVAGPPSGQRALALPVGGAVIARMTPRQASDLEASLRSPASFQWAAVYGESGAPGTDSEKAKGAADGLPAGGPEDETALHRMEKSGGFRAPANAPPPGAPAAPPAVAATQPAGPAPGSRAPVPPPAGQPGAPERQQRSAEPPAAHGIPAPGRAGLGAAAAAPQAQVSRGAEGPLRQPAAPATRPAPVDDQDQPVDVVIVLQQSPAAGEQAGPGTQPSK